MPINVEREFAGVGLRAGGGAYAPGPLPSGDLDASAAVGGATMRRYKGVGQAIDIQTQALVDQGQAIQQVGNQVAGVGSKFLAEGTAIEERKREAINRTNAANAQALILRRQPTIKEEARKEAGDSGIGYADIVAKRNREAVDEALGGITDETWREAARGQFDLLIAREEVEARTEEGRLLGTWRKGELTKRMGVYGNVALSQRGDDQHQTIGLAVADIRDSVDEGTLSPVDGEQKIAALRKDLLQATVTADATRSGVETWATHRSGGYRYLTGNDAEVAWVEGVARKSLTDERKAAIESLIQSDARTGLKQLDAGKLDGYFATADEKLAARTSLIKGIDAQAKDEERERKEAKAEAEKAQTAAYERRESDFAVAVSRGEVGLKDVEAAYQDGEGWLKPASRTRFTLAIAQRDQKVEQERQQIAMVSGALEGRGVIDPKNADHRKAVDSHYNAWQAMQKPDDPALPAKVTDYVVRVGIVPTPVKGFIRGGLRNGSDEQVVQAADTLDRMSTANKAVLDDFEREDVALGQMVGDLARAGMPVQKAVQTARDAIGKRDEGTRDLRTRQMQTEKHAKANASWLPGQLNDSFPESLITTAPAVPQAYQADFDRLYSENFLLTGDAEAARKVTLKETQRVWQKTNVDGSPRMMKYAPEAYYAVPNVDNAWMQEQLISDLAGGGMWDRQKPLDGRIRVVSDLASARERTPDGKALPSYVVQLKDDNGVWNEVRNPDGRALRWRPSYESSPAGKRAAAEQAAALTERENMLAAARARAEELRMATERRGGGNAVR